MADDLIGRKIGGYEIVELIGHGGMATVYRARQISMNRIVAVKILPRQFLNDETYMQRFNREVKIVAELEHRNIVPVHDYGEDNGQPYIVMRYMSGGSVDDLLRQGALNLTEISSILDQIAPALDYAHSHNVLHRDLKPSNILLDGSGGAYLTDFGIARLMTDVSTVTLTTSGVVGTPSYMSPEQAQGQPLDHRSDIYSLGVMLFEMTTGQRPFESDTPYGIAVLQVTARPPEPRSINPAVPVPVENVILTTMSKKREERFNTCVALSGAFQSALDAPNPLSDTQPGFPRPELRAESAPVSTPPPPPHSPAYTPPPPSSPYVMPVRRRLAPKRGSSVWLNMTVGGAIGCGLLILVTLIVLVVISVMTRNPPTSPTPTGEIPGGIASPMPATATGGSLRDNTSTPLSTQASLLATNTPTEQQNRTVTPAIPLTPAPATQVEAVGVRDTPAPLTEGTIVYFAERDGSFDIYKMNLSNRVEIRLSTAAANELYPAISPDGSHIAFMSDQDGDYDIYVMDINGGGTMKLTDNTVLDRIPSWSPDGEWIAFSSDVRGDGSHDLYRVRADGSALQPLYSSGGRSSQPRYSPDGRYLVFTDGSRSDAATWEIMRLDVDSKDVIALTDNDVQDSAPAFAPDGSIIYMTEGEGHAALARVSIDGGESSIVYDGAGYDWGADYSPDGSQLTFTSDLSGRDEIYLMPADGGDIRSVTDLGGMGAVWLPS